MKNFTIPQAFAALVLIAGVAIAPAANANETKSVDNIQKYRLEFLENQTKGVENIQKHRLTFLENQSKNVENIQKTRLEFLENQSKGVGDAKGNDFNSDLL